MSFLGESSRLDCSTQLVLTNTRCCAPKSATPVSFIVYQLLLMSWPRVALGFCWSCDEAREAVEVELMDCSKRMDCE